jgi:CxxC-x17-CxxC domain-containing protein
MDFQDKTLQCFDCDTTFIFSADEQRFFQSKGYTNEPKRCPSCRRARKERQQRSGHNLGYERQMFPAICAECGKQTEVPFVPREGRPVYCRDCYNKIRLRR